MSDSPFELRRLKELWNWFFFESANPVTAAGLRIGYSVLLLINLMVWAPDVRLWFGETGLLPYEASRAVVDPDTWTLFSVLPHTDTTARWCFQILVLQTVLLGVGVGSRFQAICVFMWLASFNHRNALIFDGEDTLFRLLAFLLALTPCGCRWSFDAYWTERRKGALPTVTSADAWGVRLIQLQMTLIYVSTAWEKLNGNAWIDGTALYFASRLNDLWGRGPVPHGLFFDLTSIKYMTWLVLLVEIWIPIGLWLKESRRWTIGLAIALHLGIEYSMHLFLFEWLMILGVMSFVQESDFRRKTPRTSQ